MIEENKKIQHKEKQKELDNALWKAVTKDVQPIKRDTVTLSSDSVTSGEPKESNAKTAKKAARANSKFINTHADDKVKSNAGNRELDYNTKRRLKRGQIKIDGKLDLHGMTQNQAYDRLLSYIPHSYEQHRRCILLVTGKGQARHGDLSLLEQKTGVLKQKTPEWLGTPPLAQYILDIQPARPQHGGDGAIYVLLRKNR